MKRVIQYSTDDGHTFDNRTAARQHEINEQRRKRVRACLEHLLKAADGKALALADVVEALCKHASEFADALSARAAVRAARKGSTKKPQRA
jgi:hypothetical protein